MYCKKCGNKINEGSNFCTNCGEAVATKNESVTTSKVENEKVETLNVSNEPINSNVQTNNSAPKKTNAAFVVLIVIFAIIILGLITFICVYSIRSNNRTIEPEITEEEPTIEENEPTQIDTSNTVSIKGYDFTIPNGWKYDSETVDGFLGVKNNENTIISYFVPLSFSSDTSDSTINSYKETIKSKGYTVNNHTIVKVDDVTFVLLDATYEGKQLYFAYASYGDYTIDSVFMVNGITPNEALQKLSVIYSSGKFESSNFASTDDKSMPVPSAIEDSFE